MSTVQQRGREIRFVKGKYIGYNGWINDHGDHTAQSYTVIVSGYKRDNGATQDKITKVRKESVRDRTLPPPNSKSEAIMQQHPEIEAAVIEMARLFASCSITDEKSVMALIGKEIRRAQAENQSLPTQTIRVVEFK